MTIRTRRLCAGLLTAPGVAAAAGAQPNPYQRVDAAQPPPHLNDGRWGETIQVRVGPAGNVYVYHRCFKAVLGDPNVAPGHSDGLTANCLGRWSGYPPVLKFAPTGEFIAGFGTGLVGRPHGFSVDHAGNMWLTDVALIPGEMGAVVHKLNPAGDLVMTLGRPGMVGQNRETFNRPSSVAVAENGDIFVADGEGPNNRIVKFAADGSFIRTWGSTGAEAGEFREPHALAMDSTGRLFVGDRGNSRLQIFDQDGNHIETWTSFGRPSGLFIDANDVLYSADSESNATWGSNRGWLRGIRIGSAFDGFVVEFIPDPNQDPDNAGTTAAEGIAVDANGSMYGAEVGPRRIRKYVRRTSP